MAEAVNGGQLCCRCRAGLRGDLDVSSGRLWQSWRGDAEIVLDRIDEPIDCIVTDPPYGTGAALPAARLAPSSKKYSSAKQNTHPELACDSLLPTAWRSMLANVLGACARLIKPGGYLLMFTDWRALSDMLEISGRAGFAPCGVIVWDKGRSARPRPNGFRSQTEFILWARYGGAPQLDGPPVYLDGVFRHNTPRRTYHLTEKPVALMRDIMGFVRPGMTVLDPFQGAGTTGVAALELGSRYIGIEMVHQYWETANRRLAEAESRVKP